MNVDIFLILLQDGFTNGAIYALIAISLVLVFAVTRIIFIPQGEFVAYGALTAAALDRGMFPSTAVLLLAVGLAAALRTIVMDWGHLSRRACVALGIETIVLPSLLTALAWALTGSQLGLLTSATLSLAMVTLLGPLIYRLAFQPLENRSTFDSADRGGRRSSCDGRFRSCDVWSGGRATAGLFRPVF